jgi:hypothetical protein
MNTNPDWYRNAVEHLAKLAPIEAIELSIHISRAIGMASIL